MKFARSRCRQKTQVPRRTVGGRVSDAVGRRPRAAISARPIRSIEGVLRAKHGNVSDQHGLHEALWQVSTSGVDFLGGGAGRGAGTKPPDLPACALSHGSSWVDGRWQARCPPQSDLGNPMYFNIR